MLHKDEWLSQYFAGGAYRLSAPYEGALHDGAFTYVKLPQDQQSEVAPLCAAGFRFVEVLLQFEQVKPVPFTQPDGYEISYASADDREEVIGLAGNAFTASRFFTDAQIPQDLAVKTKSDWVDNFFSGQRGDGMVVARKNGKACAFLLLVNRNVIDLIAVDENCRGSGIARAMIAFANQDRGLLKAGTQLVNKASIALYQSCGFLLKDSSYVLHWTK
jgi:ribosomal protein S18 acetylase RimI-like enzyme